MRALPSVLTTFIVLAILAAAPASTSAADRCTGFITSLPAVITEQGVWCLRGDLRTAQTSGNAIEIRTSLVTIDCNGFKIDGLPAGRATFASGIYATGRRVNITVRNCTMRGFRGGITIQEGSQLGTGHLVEDNVLDMMTASGIYVLGHGSIVRRNRVLNTVGAPGSDRATAITVFGDALDNVVDGMRADDDAPDFRPEGIYSGGVGNFSGSGFLVQGNRVRNVTPKGTGEARGLVLAGTAVVVRDNVVVQPEPTPGTGIFCSLETIVRRNVVRNYSGNISSCSTAGDDAGGNLVF
jgi:hypothetical protein